MTFLLHLAYEHMKYAPLIFFMVLLSGCSATKEFAELEGRLAQIETTKIVKPDSTGLHLLPEIETLMEHECFEENKAQYYHVTDLNADGRNDFIYSGACDPYQQVMIFLNTGTGWKWLFTQGNEVTSITKTSTGSVVDMIFTGCCGADYNSLPRLVINNDSIVSRNEITWFANTEVPLEKPFKKIRVSGVLRTFPGIDDHLEGGLLKDSIPGNHLVKISTFTEVIQLNEIGRWRLVVYPETKERSYIGWINVER